MEGMMNKYFAFIVMLLIPIDIYASYFNTDRPQKIIGSFLNEVEHIHEIRMFSNAFGFVPRTANEITQYFDANVHKMLPVITISNLLFEKETGMYQHDVNAIIDAIEKSSLSHREILFLMDEPLWWVRNACEEGKPKACYDVENRYVETLATLRLVGQLLRKQFSGSGVIHIEAWAELVLQKNTHPGEDVIMLDDAEYLGFDCYGDFDYCGSPEYGYSSQIDYGTWVWEAMHTLESINPIGRKLFLVPGSFLADQHFASIKAIMDQMYIYAYILSQSNKIGGFGIFLWGDMVENEKNFIGARNISLVANFIAFVAEYFGVENKSE